MAIARLAHSDARSGDGHAERRIREQFERALSNEEATGRRFSTGALLIGLGVISIWLFIQVELARVWYYQAIIGMFGLLVLANYVLAQTRWDRPWRTYVFQVCFLALLVAVIILPNPFVESWPIQTRLRFGNFVYVLLFLTPIALTFRPLAMIWAGLCAALAWAIGVAWVASRPESKTYWNPDSLAPMGSAEALDPVPRSELRLRRGAYSGRRDRPADGRRARAGGLALAPSGAEPDRSRARAGQSRALFRADRGRPAGPARRAARRHPSAAGRRDVRRHRRLHALRRGLGSANGGRDAAPVPWQARARDLRPWRHARQVPGRRRHGDLRHAAGRAARCAQRTRRRARCLRRDRELECRARPRAASRRSLSRSASTTDRWCSATSGRSVGWSSPCWATWSTSRSAWRG